MQKINYFQEAELKKYCGVKIVFHCILKHEKQTQTHLFSLFTLPCKLQRIILSVIFLYNDIR